MFFRYLTTAFPATQGKFPRSREKPPFRLRRGIYSHKSSVQSPPPPPPELPPLEGVVDGFWLSQLLLFVLELPDELPLDFPEEELPLDLLELDLLELELELDLLELELELDLLELELDLLELLVDFLLVELDLPEELLFPVLPLDLLDELDELEEP